ncbi:MAG TPA: Cof-type HAD-IIB family hydrolase [Candidatus Acidoferrales bacterium]|nr:Cof-type HAD-IIB family hydrolase [Candidatus Acidoferrales bacterium]
MPTASSITNLATPANPSAPVKLIATDIDGTLLDSQSRLSAENVAAVAEAAAAGIQIMIVTGRRFHSARWTVDALPCDFNVIATNGALVKSKDGITLQRHLLPAHIARRVLDATEEFRACAGVIFDRPRERQVIFEKIDWNGAYIGPYLSRHREFVAEVAPLSDCLDEDPLEVMFLGECDRIARAMKILENLPHANEYTLAQTVYAHRNLSMLDVLRRGVNKGSALEAWATHQGIAREEVMALGDNWNDREMLEFAGLPVAMGNCVPELHSLGCQITLSNDEHGVAHAIRKYVLNGSGR